MSRYTTAFDGLTIIVSEKPSLTRALLPHLACEGFDPSRTIFIHSGGLGPFQFQLPRGVPRRDYPLIRRGQYTVRDDYSFRARRLDGQIINDRDLIDLVKGPSLRFICACDPDEVGAALFYETAKYLANKAPGVELDLEQIPDIRVVGLDDRLIKDAIDLALSSVTMASDRQPWIERKRIQRAFEFNYWTNAHVLLREAMERFGLSGSTACLSKNAMQLLYVLADRIGDWSEGECIQIMERWVGTGRYPRGQMGSVKSRYEILLLLQRAGAIEVVNRRGRYQVSQQGREFLAALPKSTRDVDLPMRLEEWKEQGAEGQIKAERYLATWFKRIKTWLDEDASSRRKPAPRFALQVGANGSQSVAHTADEALRNASSILHSTSEDGAWINDQVRITDRDEGTTLVIKRGDQPKQRKQP